MKISLYSQQGKKLKDKEVPKALLKKEISSDLVHRAIVTALANQRVPIAHTKDRSEVRGGGRKPWRQKGTGRARHGSIRSPLWKGGGVTFGPRKEKKYHKQLSKKMKRLALLKVLQEKLKKNRVLLLKSLSLKKPKTKELSKILDKLVTTFSDFKKEKDSLLILMSKIDQNLKLAARNLERIEIGQAKDVNAYLLAKFQYLILTEKAFGELEKRLLFYERKRSSDK